MANLSNINNYFVVDTTGKVAIGDVSAATIPTLLTQLTLYDNTATASLVIQSGAASGKKYELGSSSTGKFQITDLDASVDRLTVDSSGNVGIGTSSPSAKLTIQGTNSANGGIKIQNSGGNPYAIYSDNNDLLFTNGNGSTTALTIAYSGNATFAGNVGIGVTPSTSYTDSRAIELGANGYIWSEQTASIYGSFMTGVGFYYNSSGATEYKTTNLQISRHVQYQGEHLFQYAAAGTAGQPITWSEAFRTSDTGKVGIGTTSPIGKTDIFVGASGYTNNITTLPVGTWSFANGSGANSYPSLVSKSNATGAGMTLVAATDDGAPNGMDFNIREGDNTDFSTLTTSGFTFSRFGTNLMTILRNGSVGIGTSSITNYGLNYTNLDISGSNGAYLTLIGTTNTVKVDIAAETNAGYVGTKTAHPFIFRTNDVERMRIDSSGITTFNNAAIVNNYVSIKTASATGSPYIDFIQDSTQKGYIQYWDSGEGLTFQSDSNHIFLTGSSSERMRIATGGYVGIANNNPASLLSVGSVSYGSTARIDCMAADSQNAEIRAFGNAQGTGVVYVGQSTYYGGGIAYNGDGSPVYGDFGTDRVTLFGRHGGTSHKVADWSYSNTDKTFAFYGPISVSGSTGTAGQVLTSNGSSQASWQTPSAGGGSAWPQEKFAEYTINSTTSNILVATMNSTTWHGNYLAGCLKFTLSTSDYIQVTYIPVSTFLSGTSKWFFKGTEMTTKNNGSNAAKLVFTFAGDQGSFGSTCTIKINRNQSESNYTKVNVLVQAISNPNMFILN